jgi:hypothetical protein
MPIPVVPPPPPPQEPERAPAIPLPVVNHQNRGVSPLYVACAGGFLPVVMLLLDRGASTCLVRRSPWVHLHESKGHAVCSVYRVSSPQTVMLPHYPSHA